MLFLPFSFFLLVVSIYCLSCLCQGAFLSDNMEEWRRKLIMLLRDKEKQELVSREKKDRRDFEQIATLASRMGLYRYLVFHQNRCFSLLNFTNDLN